VPEDKGMLVTAFLESFFKRYVEFDFTANLEEKLDRVSNAEIDWKVLLREFWEEFTKSIGDTKDLRVTEVLEALNGVLGAHVFPVREDGGDPRICQVCGTGNLSLKLGKYGAFVGCSNYPECSFTRQLGDAANPNGENGGGEDGTKVLGKDPYTAEEITLRSGRFGPYIQRGDGKEAKRSSLPKGWTPDSIDHEKALALLSLPRDVEEAAILDGNGPWGIFWRIALPMSRGPLITIGLTTIVWSWKDFLWPLLVGRGEDNRLVTVALGVFLQQSPNTQPDWTGLMAASTLSVLPVLILLVLMGKRLVQSLSFTGNK
jgi:ssDNA-binding Zn-finger/Zn-ribbon topoisomerase 1